MTYTVEDITELIRYPLVAAAPSDEVADRNLKRLVRDVEPMMVTPVHHEPIYWTACEECGAWVSSELIGPEGAGGSDDGVFYCTPADSRRMTRERLVSLLAAVCPTSAAWSGSLGGSLGALSDKTFAPRWVSTSEDDQIGGADPTAFEPAVGHSPRL